MIYLNNIDRIQTVYIPRNDGLGSVHTVKSYEEGYADGIEHQKELLSSTTITINGEYERENGWSAITVNVPTTANLEESTIVISSDTTNVVPDAGYDGFSAITIDATEYGQSNYDSGFEDGYIDGYSSGSTEGYESGYTSGETDGYAIGFISGETHQKSLLSTTAFTHNGEYQNGNGYSAITVNVPQTGHTDQELENAYNSGHTEGMEEQKALLSSTALTENGSYTSENGWSGVTVNIDTASTYNSGYTSGYTSGHTDGVNDEKAKMSAVTFTANTAVTLSDGSYSAVTVNVPQTGHTDQEILDAYNSGYTSGETDVISTFISTAVTENGVYGSSAHPYSSITVNVDTASTYNSGYTSGVTDGENNIVSTFSSMTATTNGVYGSSAHPLSSITVNVPQTGSSSGLTEFINRTITSVVIPNDCTLIGQYAFNGCRSLTSVTFHSGITIIGYNSFQYCVNLKEAIIPDSADVYDSAFDNCTGLTAVTIGKGINYIRTGTFRKCYSLTDVVIPDSVEIIGEEAFYNCIHLDTITIGSGCTSIMHRAFLGCSGLSVINVNASTAPSLQTYVFANIPSTGTVHYPAGSNYSSWQNDANLSGWTFISDL